MRKIALWIYTLWIAFWFFLVFLLLWPLFWLFLQNKKTHFLAHHCNRIWGLSVFLLSFCFLIIEKRHKIEKDQRYVIVANHTSFLDIPTLYLVFWRRISFIGKSSLGKVPLFGYMYSRLHVLVDRKSVESKRLSLEKCKEKIEEGNSMVFFPEGTISRVAPDLTEFKDGAFRLAIEKQIPILPVSIPYNWIILPDKWPMYVHPHYCKVIVHEPLDTKGLSMEDVQNLKSKAFEIIDQEIKKHNKR